MFVLESKNMSGINSYDEKLTELNNVEGVLLYQNMDPKNMVNFASVLTKFINDNRGMCEVKVDDKGSDMIDFLKAAGVDLNALLQIINSNNTIQEKIAIVTKMLKNKGIVLDGNLLGLLSDIIKHPEILAVNQADKIATSETMGVDSIKGSDLKGDVVVPKIDDKTQKADKSFLDFLKAAGVDLNALLQIINSNNTIQEKIAIVTKMLKDKGIALNGNLLGLLSDIIKHPEILAVNQTGKPATNQTMGRDVDKMAEHKADVVMPKSEMSGTAVGKSNKGAINQITIKVKSDYVPNMGDVKSVIGTKDDTSGNTDNTKFSNNKFNPNSDMNFNVYVDSNSKVPFDLNRILKPNIQVVNKPIVNTADVFNQILNGVKLSINLENHQYGADIKLKPEFLGNLSLNIEVDKGIVNAQITVQNYQVKEIIEANLMQLRDALQQQGLNVNNLNVTVDPGSSGNFTQGNGYSGKKNGNEQKFYNKVALDDVFVDLTTAGDNDSLVNYLI